MSSPSLQHFATPGRFTDLSGLEDLPCDLDQVVSTAQGLLIYDTVAQPLYGVDLSPRQAEAIHERDSARLLSLATAVDPRPLTEPRPPALRLGGRCHAFSRLTVAFLRANGVPARARCGFGTRFRPGWFEDHWIAEYWSAGESRWVMVDAQLDDVWRELLGFAGDPLDLDPGDFVSAGHAWQAWRRGELDADRCGLSAVDEHGSFWIAGNLRLDLASLNKVEMLPWDVWGVGIEPGERPSDDLLALFDSVAELTVDPDHRFPELRDRYERDPRLRMDGEVFNVLRDRTESVN